MGPMRPIGFGGRALARDTQRVLFEAIEAGVAHVDVSPAWGDSEALSGETIRELRARDRVVLATVADPARLERSIEGSLRATRLDAIPLAQIAVDEVTDELRDAMAQQVKEGKVLRWGRIASDARKVSIDPAFATIQVPFHLQDRRAAALIVSSEAAGVVIVRRPLDGGGLAPLAADALAFVLAHPIALALVGMSSREHLRANLLVASGGP